VNPLRISSGQCGVGAAWPYETVLVILKRGNKGRAYGNLFREQNTSQFEMRGRSFWEVNQSDSVSSSLVFIHYK
jgi:hypothetical protein